MSELPHVLLARAADRLERLAAATVAGPWSASGGEVRAGGDEQWPVAGNAHTGATAAWIAALSPAVAPHLVTWLRDTAMRCESQPHLSVEGSTPRKAALAFARQVLASAPSRRGANGG